MYQSLFNGGGDLLSIMKLPYPLYRDVIIAQVEEKKREHKVMKDQMSKREQKMKIRK